MEHHVDVSLGPLALAKKGSNIVPSYVHEPRIEFNSDNGLEPLVRGETQSVSPLPQPISTNVKSAGVEMGRDLSIRMK